MGELLFLRLGLGFRLFGHCIQINLAEDLDRACRIGFRLGRRFSSLFFSSSSRFGWRFRLNAFHLRLLLALLENRQVNFYFRFLLRRSGLARRSQGYAFAVHHCTVRRAHCLFLRRLLILEVGTNQCVRLRIDFGVGLRVHLHALAGQKIHNGLDAQVELSGNFIQSYGFASVSHRRF